jgi:phosphopantetheinyl transferase
LFFRYWTRKESIIKGIGKGLYLDLRNIDVSGRIPEVVSANEIAFESIRDWALVDIPTFPAYSAACAYRYTEINSFRYFWTNHEICE